MSDSASSIEEMTLLGYDPDSDYDPEPRLPRTAPIGRGARRGRPRGSGRGQARASTSTSSVVRGTGRRRGGRGRGRGRLLADLTQEDFDRVKELQEQRIAMEKARIQRLSLQDCQQLLQRCLDREPGLILDLLSLTPDPPAPDPRPPQAPGWCICSNCKNMPTLLEQKCCQQVPQNCISRLPHMDLYILNEGTLRLARRIWNDLRAEVDGRDIGETNRQFRYAAYRNFVMWQYGILGPGNRVVLPSCCVTRVRNAYPDPNGVYVGFIPARV